VNQAPSVTIVIVNFRTPRLTLECIQSLRKLNYANWKLVVVDNASDDGSAELFQAHLRSDEFIRARENGGYTAGNNLGVRAALERGAQYVLVLNPDTIVCNPHFLGELVDHLENNPTVGAVGPRVFLREAGRVQNTVLKFPWLWRRVVDWVRTRTVGQPTRSGSAARSAEALNGVCVLFRSEAFRHVGLFDERTFAYIEDIDWAYRAHRLGWSQEYIPVDSVIHLQKQSGYERGSTVDFLLKRNTLYFLMKSNHWLQAVGYTAITLSLSLIHALRSGSLDWCRRLGSTYARLWTARWNTCMGRPR
jgi:hypothetical protein